MADEEDNTETEMLGKRKNIPQDNSQIDVGMKAKKEFYDNAMKQATEKVKSKSNFADAETQEQEDMYLLQQMMRNNKKFADLKAKQATDRLSELLHKKEIHVENDDLVSLDNMESDKNKHADLASIAKKAQMDLDPFKVPER